MNEPKWIKVQDFFRQASVSIGAGAARTSLVSYVVPGKFILRITHVANYAGDVSAWGFLTWAIEHNSIGMYPMNAFRDLTGSLGEPVAIEPMDFPGGAEFSVKASNSDASAHVAGILIRGELGYYE